jgi:hypothetical protein
MASRVIQVGIINPDGTEEVHEWEPSKEFWEQWDADSARIEERVKSGDLLGWCENGSHENWRYFDNRPSSPDYMGPEMEEPRAGASHGWLCQTCGKLKQVG